MASITLASETLSLCEDPSSDYSARAEVSAFLRRVTSSGFNALSRRCLVVWTYLPYLLGKLAQVGLLLSLVASYLFEDPFYIGISIHIYLSGGISKSP